jgi:hypothetical protein
VSEGVHEIRLPAGIQKAVRPGNSSSPIVNDGRFRRPCS